MACTWPFAVANFSDFDFALAHASGFDDDDVKASRIKESCEFRGGAGDAAGCSASGHGADEDAGISVMLLHANAVAQQGAAGDGA